MTDCKYTFNCFFSAHFCCLKKKISFTFTCIFPNVVMWLVLVTGKCIAD